MAGLLDGGDYMPDPMNAGLLNLGVALMTPRQLGGGIGPGLMAFQQGAQQAQQMRRQMAQDEMARKLYELKLSEAQESAEDRKRKRAQEEALRQAATSAYVPASPGSLGGGVTPGSQQGIGLMSGLTGGASDEDRAFDAALLASDNRVLNENAARQGAPTSPVAPPTAGGFSNTRFVDNLRRAGMPLEAAEYAKKLQGESPFAKVDPKDYTPESMAAFISSGGTDMSLLRRADPSKTLEYGLEPKVGFNTKNNQWELFVQDKGGGTKWLGIKAPPNYQYQSGSDYTPSVVFDPRSGSTMPPRPMVPGASPAPTAPVVPGAAPSAAPAVPPAAAAQEPADPLAPWRNLPPKRADDVRIRTAEAVRKQLDEEREALKAEASKIEAMRRFGLMNQRTTTGAVSDSWRPNWLSSSDTVEMRSITAQLAPRERVAGTGASSDRDVALFMAAVPSVDKPGPVNAAIRKAREAQYQRDRDYVNEKEAYFNKYGHVEGFDRMWSDYADKVPLFDPKATTQDFKLSDKRPTFAEWSRRNAPKASTGGQTGEQVGGRRATEADIVATVRSSGKSRDEVIRALRDSGYTIDSPMVR